MIGKVGTKYGKTPKTIRQRLEENYEPEPTSGCWLWTGLRTAFGYGRLHVGHVTLGNRKTTTAHRLSYEAFIGPIPADMQVLHRCDTPPCINPAHLFLGTQQDNLRDALLKRRVYSKVSWEDVDAIRRGAIEGIPQTELARRYGLTQVAVGCIINEKTWKPE